MGRAEQYSIDQKPSTSKVILNYIKHHGPVDISDIVEGTGYTRHVVQIVIGALEAHHLICQSNANNPFDELLPADEEREPLYIAKEGSM